MEALSGRPAASYYLVALAAAAAVVWFATNLRRSRVGRALAAGRDSDAAARSLGIDPAHYRLVALSFSAVVAALGGIVAAYGEQPLDPTRFAIFLSVQYFLYTVVGGARSLAGAAVVVFAFEVAPALQAAARRPPARPASWSSAPWPPSPWPPLPVALAGLVQRAVGRLAPAPVRRRSPPRSPPGSPASAGRPIRSLDDPFAADDPFVDDGPRRPSPRPVPPTTRSTAHGHGDGRA